MIRCLFAIPATLALGSGMLLAAVQPGRAADLAPAAPAATTARDGSFATSPGSAATMSAQDLCPAGMAGFGWG